MDQNKKLKELKWTFRILVVFTAGILIFLISVITKASPENIENYLEKKYDQDFYITKRAGHAGWITAFSAVPVAEGDLEFQAGICFDTPDHFPVFVCYAFTDNYPEKLKEKRLQSISSQYDLRLDKISNLSRRYSDTVLPYICDSKQLIQTTDNISEIVIRMKSSLERQKVFLQKREKFELPVFIAGKYRLMTFDTENTSKIREQLMSEYVKLHTIAIVSPKYKLSVKEKSEPDMQRTCEEIYEICNVVRKELKSFMLPATDAEKIEIPVQIDGKTEILSLYGNNKTNIRNSLENIIETEE